MYKKIILATAIVSFCIITVSFSREQQAENGTLTILDHQKKELFRQAEDLTRSSVQAKQFIPYPLLASSIITEDQRFWSHQGTDPLATIRAFWQLIDSQRHNSGGSTISQQVSRNMLGINRPRNFLNKASDILLSSYLESIYTKDDILQYYFHHINFGNSIIGTDQASWQYFDSRLENIEWSQAILLSALIKNANQINDPTSLKTRQNYIANLLGQHQILSLSEITTISDTPPKIHQAQIPISAPHFVYFVIQSLEEKYGQDFWHGHQVEVITTLDLDQYEKSKDITTNELSKLDGKNVSNSANIILDNTTGEIISYLGNNNFFDIDHAGAVDMTQALRQPGSALKPFVYLAAILEGWGSGTVLYDIPSRFLTSSETPYTPLNYDLDFHGPVTMRQALANSYNVPAVKALEFVGISKIKKLLQDFGIDTLVQPDTYYGLSLALGSGEVTLYQLTNAYRALANRGQSSEPQFIKQITIDQQAYDVNIPQKKQYTNNEMQQASDIITNILSDTKAREPAFEAYNVLSFPYPVAAKTGTSRNFHDNWTFGYSENYTVGVWTGNSDGSAMSQVSGIAGAGPIFQRILRSLPIPTKQERFSLSPEITRTTICLPSGLLPSVHCKHSIEELFLAGKAPTTQDSWYQSDGLHLPTELSAWQRNFANTIQLANGITIVRPQEKDVFQFDPETPDNTEIIPCQIVTSQLTAIRILVNDQLISTNPDICRLPKAAGNYTLTVEGTNNQQQNERKSVHYRVIASP